MRRVLVSAAILLALSAGCSDSGPPAPAPTPAASPAAAAPERGGTVVIGILADLENFNPYLTDTATAEDVLALIYPSLAVEQVDYREHPPSFAPNLATSWEQSEDGRRLTFHLRPDVVWSDGAPVTADDVVFTWRTQTSAEVGWSGGDIKKFITDVVAVDPHTVRFEFDHKYPYQLMDANDGLIIPAHAWRSIPYAKWEQTDWTEHTVSAGPFQLASYSPQQEIVLARNPHYWRAPLPRLERAVWRVIPDQSTMLTQLLTGDIDLMEGIPPRDAERIRHHPDLQLITFPDRSYVFIGWNLRRPPFSDARVRRALTMAIDRTAVLDTVLRGFGRPSLGPILSTMWAFDRKLEPLPHDLDAARKLLAEAGWVDRDGDGVIERNGHPFNFELLTLSGNETREDVCILVQNDLARVGIRVTPRYQEWGVVWDRLQRGDFDAFVSGWREGTQVEMEGIWTTAAPDEPTFNYEGYSNPEVDRLIRKARATTEISERKRLYDRIQELIVRDQPYTFLYEGERLDGLNRRVRGAVINDATPYFNIDEWYIAEPPQAG